VFRSTLLLLVIAAPFAVRADDTPPIDADLLLEGGTLYDGSGRQPVVGHVAIRKGRIVAVGEFRFGSIVQRIDCTGMVVCPGFIDLHSHSDGEIDAPLTRANVNFVTQGCTTVVTGNCGSGPVDAAAYYKRIEVSGAGTNVAHLLPQGSLRADVMGTAQREPTAEELERMRELADRAMADGAWGMSTGLIYVPSSYASTDEIVELAKVVSRHGGIYASHIRGEGLGVIGSVQEAMEIGERAGCPVHVSHFKSSGRESWGLVRRAADLIAEARAAGRKVTADQYPYIASSTSLDATIVPTWALSGGRQRLIERLDSAEEGPKLLAAITDDLEKKDGGAALRIVRYAQRPEWAGKSLVEIAAAEGEEPLAVALGILRGGGASIVNFGMDEGDVRHVMQRDFVATASDGSAYVPGADKPHPRNYGTFPRKLGHYALGEKVIPLEHAIRSATGLPADIMGFEDRGYLRQGLAADVTVFDPGTLRDAATFDDPHRYSEGVRYVFVNGEPALYAGAATGALPGRALRHVSTAK
jgi:N-acyl-D-amino-acid deacylase